MNPKLIAYYLPQFHQIPENSEAWGEGFTEWVNVKKAKPLFYGHNQPRIPLNNNYYDLLDDETLEWQANLANQYGVYGFCFYHYWFGDKMVLEKPIEKLLNSKNININFCFSWANESWTKTWHGAKGAKEILIQQTYGDKIEWEKHFNYFLTYFKDERYIKVNNKPMLLITRVKNIIQFNEMFSLWNNLALQNGYDGLHIVIMSSVDNYYLLSENIEATVNWEPLKRFGGKRSVSKQSTILDKKYNFLSNIVEPFKDFINLRKLNYITSNNSILNEMHQKNEYRSVYVDFDDSARRQNRALVTIGSHPKLFGYFLRENIKKSLQEGNDYIFINAWNEWGEGNYLEPDEKYKYGYLEEVKKVMDSFK